MLSREISDCYNNAPTSDRKTRLNLCCCGLKSQAMHPDNPHWSSRSPETGTSLTSCCQSLLPPWRLAYPAQRLGQSYSTHKNTNGLYTNTVVSACSRLKGSAACERSINTKQIVTTRAKIGAATAAVIWRSVRCSSLGGRGVLYDIVHDIVSRFVRDKAPFWYVSSRRAKSNC